MITYTHTVSDPNTPLRMYIALRLLRAWNSGTAGFSADVVMIVNRWIDEGMKGPIPWPDNPFFEEWAEANGFVNIRGHVGFTLRVALSPFAITLREEVSF